MNELKKIFESNVASCHEIEFDYIIIGSGAAGSSSAITLAEQGYNILVVEAGPLALTDHVGSTSLRYNPELLKTMSSSYSSYSEWENQNQEKFPSQTWTVAGGRTLFWGGHSPRFLDSDFETWPIAANQLKEDYEWAERHLGVNRHFFHNQEQENLIKMGQESTINLEPSPLAVDAYAGNSRLPHLLFSGISRLLSSKYFTADIQSKGIHLLCDMQAIRLEAGQGHITSLVLEDRLQSHEVRLRAKHYVLACGALRSNQLVLNSNLKLEHQPGTGISEHLFCKGLIRLRQPLTAPVYLHATAALDEPYLFEIHGPLGETWYDNNYATVWLDWHKNTQYLLLYGFGVAEINPDNRVILDNSTLGYKVYYQHTPHDIETFSAMATKAKKIATALGGSLQKIEFQPPGMSYHERGGLVMSEEPPNGLVNERGTFWNYKNLHCTDPAIWPSQGASNPCLTITAIARYLMRDR